MDSNIVCNGKATTSASQATNKNDKLAADEFIVAPNLNWLIHMAYARQDFNYCKDVIAHQFCVTYDHEYLYFVKGLIARDEGKLNESLQSLQKAYELNPDSMENLKEIGKTLYALERWRQALEVFMKIDKTSPRPDHEVCYYIGELLYRNHNKSRANAMDEAKEYFHRAIRHGKQIESYHKLAEIYKTENNLPKSIEMLENTLQLNGDNIDILTEIGILYLRINDTKGAFDKLFDVTKSDENCSKALLALGSILQSKNDIDGALNKYKLIDAEGQKGSEIWSNVGLCFFKKKKFIAAISCLKKSVWIQPTNFNCLFNLGLVFLTAQQYASAFHALAAAACIRTDFAECYMLLGICLKNLNDYGNAFLAFERSVMLPDAIRNPLVYLNFAIFCWRTKRFEMASTNLQNFFDVAASTSVRHEFKMIADKLKDLLPEPVTAVPPREIVDRASIHAHADGAGETMAELDSNADLV